MGGLRTWLTGRQGHALMPLPEALAALGRQGVMGDELQDVQLDQIVGTLARAQDFDADFRLVNRRLRPQWERVRTQMDAGAMPPIDLIRLGELYFVVDGHHRVSVARAQERPAITARVRHICTTAYAMCCLRQAQLPNKAAERAFLQRIPLADDVRTHLWLDRPEAWPRLADAAESWAFTQALQGNTLADREELARTWWTEEVAPLVRELRVRGTGAGLRDVELYASALSARDRLGLAQWPDDLAEIRLPGHAVAAG